MHLGLWQAGNFSLCWYRPFSTGLKSWESRRPAYLFPVCQKNQIQTATSIIAFVPSSLYTGPTTPVQGTEWFTWTFLNPSLEVNGFLSVPSTLPTETCFYISWSSPPCTEAPPSGWLFKKKKCDEWGTAVYTSGATEISQDAVVFDSRLHVTQETFTIFLQKNQKILRKQKIRSSRAYRREVENSPKPTTKTTPQYTAPIILFHVFWLKRCTKQWSLPFSTLGECNTVWTEQLQDKCLCNLP